MFCAFLMIGSMLGCTSEPTEVEEPDTSDISEDPDDTATDTGSDTGSTSPEPPDEGCELDVEYVVSGYKFHMWSITYDGEDRWTWYGFNPEFGGGTPYQIWNTYDQNGDVSVYEHDQGYDGLIEEHYEYAYNDLHQEVSSWLDTDGDGLADQSWSIERDKDGHILSEHHDEDSDGVADNVWANAWSSDFSEQTRTTDLGSDGDLDGVEFFQYDSSGNILAGKIDTAPYDGSLDYQYARVYDDDDQLIESYHDVDGDDEWDIVTLYTWTDSGSDTISRYEDGVLSSLYQYHYTADGRIDVIDIQYSGGSEDKYQYRWNCAE